MAANETVESGDFQTAYARVQALMDECLNMYSAAHCPCHYPRFHQLAGIDCVDTGNSFKCYETDILVGLAKSHFSADDDGNLWTCPKCGSIYDYDWSDFSVYVERQRIKVKDLKARQTGKAAVTPIPLYLGLTGHSFPSTSLFRQASYKELSDYVLEK